MGGDVLTSLTNFDLFFFFSGAATFRLSAAAAAAIDRLLRVYCTVLYSLRVRILQYRVIVVIMRFCLRFFYNILIIIIIPIYNDDARDAAAAIGRLQCFYLHAVRGHSPQPRRTHFQDQVSLSSS